MTDILKQLDNELEWMTNNSWKEVRKKENQNHNSWNRK